MFKRCIIRVDDKEVIMGYSVETTKEFEAFKVWCAKESFKPHEESSVSIYINKLILKDIESNCELSFARIEDAIKNIRRIK